MGLDTYRYLGPYVECGLRRISTKTNVRSCMLDTCGEWGKEEFSNTKRFCSACGGPVGSVTAVRYHYPSIYDIFRRQYEDSFFSLSSPHEGKLILGSNQMGPRHFSFDREDVHINVAKINIPQEIAWMSGFYSKELTILIDKCEYVEVLWGFHQYTRG